MHATLRLVRSFGLRLVLSLGVLSLGAAPVATPAAAQGFGFFGNLFGGGQPQSSPPAYPGARGDSGADTDSYSRYYQPRHRASRHKHPAVQQAQEPPPPPKKAPTKNATLFVDVFGDSLGQMLANGLDDALADRDDVAVVHKARGSTGLANTAYYDWPKAIDDMLGETQGAADKADKDRKGEADAKTKPDAKAEAGRGAKDAGKATAKKDKIDVAVMMIGVNDRQPIVEDGKTLKPGTDEWTAAYRKRVLAIDEAFAKKKIPLIWVGIPIMKDDDFADGMAELNEIFRDAAAQTGATYVDTWEPFGDENGDFAAFGPDVNGQTVRLRTDDGIYFTKAGARKLAHFVEAHVRRDLDGKAPLPQLPTAETPAQEPKGAGKEGKASVAVAKPEAGPIRNLDETPAAKDGALMQVPTTGGKAEPDTRLARGQVVAPPSGRADDFRWPADKPPPAGP